MADQAREQLGFLFCAVAALDGIPPPAWATEAQIIAADEELGLLTPVVLLDVFESRLEHACSSWNVLGGVLCWVSHIPPLFLRGRRPQ